MSKYVIVYAYPIYLEKEEDREIWATEIEKVYGIFDSEEEAKKRLPEIRKKSHGAPWEFFICEVEVVK